MLVSHPMWVRGLKPRRGLHALRMDTSHPMWVRGLKQLYQPEVACAISVAPYVGAWIETSAAFLRVSLAGSHPMWVRGLKLIDDEMRCLLNVAPYVGAWIETNR